MSVRFAFASAAENAYAIPAVVLRRVDRFVRFLNKLIGAAVPVFTYLFMLWRRNETKRDEAQRQLVETMTTMAKQVKYLHDDRKFDAEYRRRKAEERKRSDSVLTPPPGA